MSRKILHTAVLAALLACSGLALAADPPALVGRISSLQGPVTVLGSNGDSNDALLNWPITGNNHITTARGGRVEFRVGSAAIRLDGDSDLEVSELDDNSLRIRLNYGSANVRVRTPDLLNGFELTTPQARLTLVEPATLHIDSERVADTTVIGVLAGSAQVDGAGSMVTLRTGKEVEVTSDKLSTGFGRHDAFDDWAQARDRADDNAVVAQRYVPDDVTGYEELDRNGSWTDSPDYGPLWTPVGVAADWAPYRDGRWIWLDPWGWTWVDNAPWGYAPSHYGRWVVVNRRWCWAPGRAIGRPVWAPALVGWVGGNQWSVAFGGRRAPGLGWYPLAPREAFVPTYHVSVEVERRLAWSHNGRVVEHVELARDHRNGVTVLPREQFEARHMVQVASGPKVMLAPGAFKNVPPASAPQPAMPLHDSNRQDWRDAPRASRNGQPYLPPAPAAGANQPGRVITAEPRRATPQRAPASAPASAPTSAPASAPVSGAPAAAEERGRYERGNEEARRVRPGTENEQRPNYAPPAAYQQPNRPAQQQPVQQQAQPQSPAQPQPSAREPARQVNEVQRRAADPRREAAEQRQAAEPRRAAPAEKRKDEADKRKEER